MSNRQALLRFNRSLAGLVPDALDVLELMQLQTLSVVCPSGCPSVGDDSAQIWRIYVRTAKEELFARIAELERNGSPKKGALEFRFV